MGCLYGMYKQATIGDINITKPTFFEFKECMKWENWNKNKGKTTYESEVDYIKYVNIMIKKYGLKK